MTGEHSVGGARTGAGNTRTASMGDWATEGTAAWMDDALCAEVSVEVFVRDPGKPVKDAKKICGGCEVRAQCLAYAVKRDERWGVWGGLAPRERRGLTVEGAELAAGVERARNRLRAARSEGRS